MNKTIQGNRKPDETSPHELEPGDYAKRRGQWFGRIPNGDLFLTANMTNHSVVEHEDGTITVSPSILCDGGMNGRWHGYLERGVWREC
jgi:hypothetical protein